MVVCGLGRWQQVLLLLLLLLLSSSLRLGHFQLQEILVNVLLFVAETPVEKYIGFGEELVEQFQIWELLQNGHDLFVWLFLLLLLLALLDHRIGWRDKGQSAVHDGNYLLDELFRGATVEHVRADAEQLAHCFQIGKFVSDIQGSLIQQQGRVLIDQIDKSCFKTSSFRLMIPNLCLYV